MKKILSSSLLLLTVLFFGCSDYENNTVRGYIEGQNTLHPPQNIYVVFYIVEPFRSKYKIGDNIMFTCDNCQERFPAKINYISPSAIYSRESSSEPVYRVRAALPEWVKKRVNSGQPVEVYVRKSNQTYSHNPLILSSQYVLKYFNKPQAKQN